MSAKRAFITGISGQDGSYLAELLLSMGYEVHGLIRRSSSPNRGRIDDIYLKHDSKFTEPLHIHYGDLTDSSNLNRLLRLAEPDEIYNLGAQSHVGISFNIPEYTVEVNAMGTLRLLDAIRDSSLSVKYYQASTSEQFGNGKGNIHSETSEFYPVSPYASSKLHAYWMTRNHRDAYGLFAVNGILFNHESPRRGEAFVTRKISLSAARIKCGSNEVIKLGNLDAVRDWGYAPEYVYGMWRMLQQETPDDYILATGVGHSVRDFAEGVFQELDMELLWEEEGLNEKGVEKKTGITRIEIDPMFFRPKEVDFLVGDPTKAKEEFDWNAKTSFKELVSIMCKTDLSSLQLKV